MVFASVMITAGSVVGGHDRRGDTGTFVAIEQMFATDDGGYMLLGRAGSRCEIREWFPDDPYPIADVYEISPLATSGSREAMCERITVLSQRNRSLVYQLAEQRGITMKPMVELTQLASGQWGLDARTDEMIDASFWSLIRHTPCGPQDRYALLRATDMNEAITILDRILEHVAELIAFQSFPPEQ
jgi:Lon protease-like protein